jgi:hypothetical protein
MEFVKSINEYDISSPIPQVADSFKLTQELRIMNEHLMKIYRKIDDMERYYDFYLYTRNSHNCYESFEMFIDRLKNYNILVLWLDIKLFLVSTSHNIDISDLAKHIYNCLSYNSTHMDTAVIISEYVFLKSCSKILGE